MANEAKRPWDTAFDAQEAQQRLHDSQCEEDRGPTLAPLVFPRPRLTNSFTLIPYTADELGVRMQCNGPSLRTVLALCDRASRTPASKGWVGFPAGDYVYCHTRRQLNVALRSLVRNGFLEVRSIRKRNGKPHGRRFRLLGWQRKIPTGAIGAVEKRWLSQVAQILPARSQGQLLVALALWFHWLQASCRMQERSAVALPSQCGRDTFYRALRALGGAALIECGEPGRYTIGGIGLAWIDHREGNQDGPHAAFSQLGPTSRSSR